MTVEIGCSYRGWIENKAVWLYVMDIQKLGNDYSILFQIHRVPRPGRLRQAFARVHRYGPVYFKLLLAIPHAEYPVERLDSLEIGPVPEAPKP